jgi:uridylate kinase
VTAVIFTDTRLMKKLFVISVGGSLVVPNEIDTKFLRAFRSLIANQAKKGARFILMIGGGKTCRNYQKSLSSIVKVGYTDLDWMGIYTTRVNAQLVRLMFGKLANPNVIEDPNKKVNFQEKILVAGGWVPGRSTDDDAVRLAKIYGSGTIINLSNIDYVYTKDPRKYKDAKRVEESSWKDFKKIIGSKRVPGGNYPFDPVAANFAEKNKLKVIIANGNNLKNLQNILEGKEFKGTEIK